MEAGLRWILILLSLVVLAAIGFDGWRRISQQKRTKSEFGAPVDGNLECTQAVDSSRAPAEHFVVPECVDDTSVQSMASAEICCAADIAAKPVTTCFILNILPEPGHAFTGSHLLPTLLTLGMRHGEMSIFHRHEQVSGNGNILFSLASATEPGTFDLDKMEAQQFYGLTLFLQIPGPTHPTNALNLMLQTAKRLAHILGGSLYDEKRQPLTTITLEQHYQIRLSQVLGKI